MTLRDTLAQLDADIAKEQARITEGIADVRSKGGQMHADYWLRLHQLRRRRAMLAVAIEEMEAADG